MIAEGGWRPLMWPRVPGADLNRRRRAWPAGRHAPPVVQARRRRGTTGETWFPPCLLDNDVLEGRPREQSEDGVVEREEAEVARRVCGDARADAAGDRRDRQRQEEE